MDICQELCKFFSKVALHTQTRAHSVCVSPSRVGLGKVTWPCMHAWYVRTSSHPLHYPLRQGFRSRGKRTGRGLKYIGGLEGVV